MVHVQTNQQMREARVFLRDRGETSSKRRRRGLLANGTFWVLSTIVAIVTKCSMQFPVDF